MSFTELKEKVYEANMQLQRLGLVVYTFGNVSEVDRSKECVAIKPSGISYEKLRVEDIVIVDYTNNVIEGKLRPSSDTKTHTHLYRQYPTIGGVCHTHSTYATAWAQAQRSIPCLGTTHADYVYGSIPCTEIITDEQIQQDYEEQTGAQIVKALGARPTEEIPMMLVAGHGPFCWGKDAAESVYHAAMCEQLAHMAWITHGLQPGIGKLKQGIIDKHYQRKHGKNAYYGQNSK